MGALRTSTVFKSGRPTYLRYTQFTKERMVNVECLGLNNPGSSLNLGWIHPSGVASTSPKPGAKVQVHSLFDGVLHIVSGEIMDVTGGSKPRIRIRVEENCLAIPLRKHQRLLVLGKVRLGQEGDIKSYNQITPHQLDISLGGFGLTVPDAGYNQGEEMEFCLDLLSKESDASNPDNISFELAGRALVCRASSIENGAGVHLGLQFLDLSEEGSENLEHWLTIHESIQRL